MDELSKMDFLIVPFSTDNSLYLFERRKCQTGQINSVNVDCTEQSN